MDRTWDLTFLYTGFDDPRFAEDQALLADTVEAQQTTVSSDLPAQEKLTAIMKTNEQILMLADKIMGYCMFTMSTDASNARAAAELDKLMLTMNTVSMLDSSIVRYVGTIEDIDALIDATAELKPFAFVVKEMKAKAAHLIPEAIEPWILQMQLSGGKSYAQLRNKLDSTHTVSYRGKDIPLSAARGLAYDSDAAVRKDAYEAEIASYKKMELPMSFCLNNIKMEARTLAKAHGYDDVLSWTLAGSRMDKETLDAMITAIKEYLPDFRRYLKAKAAYLGHKNGLPFYDLFAPVGKGGKTYTIEEAQDKLVYEMGKFTPAMADFIRNAFEQRWIDVYPHEGKEGGAYCAPVHYADRSLVMTNFSGSFSDVSTIAHELGHAWHNRCLAGLPYAMIDTPACLAETASIFNETMLSHQVLSSCSEEEQMTLLEAGLMEATQTVVDIYSRYLFENEVVDTRADHAMSVDELKDAMLRAQDASYGDGLDPDLRHPYMWACKSHYYNSGFNFYNFPYAFGLLFGKGVFAQWLEQGEAFVPKYCQLLRYCGSDTVAGVAASVGIDVHSVDFWRSSLEVVRKDVDRFCELASK